MRVLEELKETNGGIKSISVFNSFHYVDS